MNFGCSGFTVAPPPAEDMAPTGKDSAGDNIDIANLTVTQLKAACKKLKLPNHMTLDEAELISMLEGMRVMHLTCCSVVSLISPAPE